MTTKLKPLGCQVAVAKSPDNVEASPTEDHGARIQDLGGGSLFATIIGGPDPEQASVANGRIVKGLVTATGDCEHHHFEEGAAIWYFEEAAIQIIDTYVVPVRYIICVEVDG